MRTEKRTDGKLIAVAGASRHGKTAWTLQKVKAAPRLFVLRDPRFEYVSALKLQTFETLPALAMFLQETGTKAARIAWTGSDRQFDDVCRLAYAWGQLWPAVMVAEEISDVTNPAKAPEGWGELIRKGLYYGNHIYSITQRPAECDKTTWGNASLIHTHGFTRFEDMEYMARQLGAPVDQVQALEPLQYLEKIAGSREIQQGRVTF